MAIRFACANCGKYHRVDDRHAGKPGRCGRCKHRFIAPGAPKAVNAPAFVPAAVPDLWAVASPARRWDLTVAIGGGLVLAILAALAIFSGRDRIVAAAPGLAPMLPPPQAAPLAAPAHDGAAREGWLGDLELLARRVALVIASWVVVGLPLALPPLLSRRHYLSVGRWLVFAGLWACLGICSLGMGMSGIAAGAMNDTPGVVLVFLLSAYFCFFAFIGSMIAAAIHPKEVVF